MAGIWVVKSGLYSPFAKKGRRLTAHRR